MHRLAAACLAAALLLASPAQASDGPPALGDDVVVRLLSGVTFRGTMVGLDHRAVTIRSTTGMVRELPLSTVNTVYRTADPSVQFAPPPSVASAATGAPEAAAAKVAPATPAPTEPVPLPVPAPGRERVPVRVGLGVALPAAGDFPSFYLPIQVNQGFRVEPELGLVRFDVGSSSATALQLGLGLLGTSSVAPQVGTYGGLRLQLQRLDASQGGSATNIRVAGVLGGEWQPVPQVAIGVEAQLAYVSLDRSITSDASTASNASGLTTAGLLFFRVFLH